MGPVFVSYLFLLSFLILLCNCLFTEQFIRIRPATRSTEEVLRPQAPGPRRSALSEHCDGRFACPLSEDSFKDSVKERVPRSTNSNTRWAYNLWKEWRIWRQFRPETKEDSLWPIPTLKEGTVKCLDYWLARFITEIRRQDKQVYNDGINL